MAAPLLRRMTVSYSSRLLMALSPHSSAVRTSTASHASLPRARGGKRSATSGTQGCGPAKCHLSSKAATLVKARLRAGMSTWFTPGLVTPRPLPRGASANPLPEPPIALSIITPIYNEEQNIPKLLGGLVQALSRLNKSFKIIEVNDGSRDGSLAALRRQAMLHPELKVLDFRRNYGQTAAIMAGIDHASGDVIISIDADLQNDPADIPELLAKLDEGFDVVSGWRKDRNDGELRRNMVSRIANRVISRI